MSDYSRANSGGSTHFTDKDALSTGDADKVIIGSQYDAEFEAIVTAVASKFDSSDIASLAEAQAESSNTKLMSPLRTANWADANGGIIGDLQALADPGSDKLFGWDESGNVAIAFTLGTGLTSSTTNINVDMLGLQALADPGADRIFFWDDGAGASAFLAVSTGLTLSGTNLTTDDSAIVHDDLSGFVTNEHIDHSAVSVIAGEGLAGGGTIAADRTINIDLTELTQLLGNALAAGDEFLVDDNGTSKAIRYQDAGVIIATEITVTTNKTFTDAEMNQVFVYNNAGDTLWDLDSGVGIKGNFLMIIQKGAGSVDLSGGTASITTAVGDFTRAAGSVICGIATADSVWFFYGDMATS